MSKRETTKASDRMVRVIAIADFLFEDPGRKTSDVRAAFCEKWQVSKRTIERLTSEAREYNFNRLGDLQDRKSEQIDREAAKYAGKIISRMESLAILSEIARGKDGNRDGDRINAVSQIAAMEGWNAPAKQDIKLSGGVAAMSDDEIEKELERLKNE